MKIYIPLAIALSLATTAAQAQSAYNHGYNDGYYDHYPRYGADGTPDLLGDYGRGYHIGRNDRDDDDDTLNRMIDKIRKGAASPPGFFGYDPEDR